MTKRLQSPTDTPLYLPIRFPMHSPHKNITFFESSQINITLEALWTTSKQKITKLSLLQGYSPPLAFEHIQNARVLAVYANVDFEIAFIQCHIFKPYNINRKPLKKHSAMNMHHQFLNPLAYSSQYNFIATPQVVSPVYYLDTNWHINSQLLSQSMAYNNFLMLAAYQHDNLTLLQKVQPHSQEKQLNTITENLEERSGLGLQTEKKKSGSKKENGKKMEKKGRKYNVLNGNERFIKKNTESNVVNQVFSFLWTPEKSKKILSKILQDDATIELFYYLMQNIKVHCKSQLNRHFLKELLSSNDWQAGFKKLKKKIKKIDEEDMIIICCAIRKLVFLYLREKSHFTIMTSKKMNMDLWTMHFAKCRELISFFFEIEP